MAGANITADMIRSAFDYDPDTGVFRRKITSGGAKAGSVAGCINIEGYCVIRYRYTLLYAHRLAWIYVYGEWPSNQVDHINSIRSDNRIANLRDVDQPINMQNRKRADKDSKLGVLGVSLSRGLYKAQIQVNGTNKFIGRFATIDEARAAYVELKRIHHEGNTL